MHVVKFWQSKAYGCFHKTKKAFLGQFSGFIILIFFFNLHCISHFSKSEAHDGSRSYYWINNKLFGIFVGLGLNKGRQKKSVKIFGQNCYLKKYFKCMNIPDNFVVTIGFFIHKYLQNL